jgi:hypothetical protein
METSLTMRDTQFGFKIQYAHNVYIRVEDFQFLNS